MKKTYLATAMALELFSSVTFSGTMGQSTDYNYAFNGLNFGIGVAGVNNISNIILGDIGTASRSYAGIDASGSSGFLSVGGFIKVGYGLALYNQVYVGAELAYRYAPTVGGNIAQGSNAGFQQYFIGQSAPHDLAPLARVGYFFVPGAMLYLGVVLTQPNLN